MAQAARRLGVTRQGVQRVANDLVAEGLAVFGPNPDHRGSPLLALTPDGHRVLNGITARADEVHRTLAAGIPPGEIAGARASLRRLIEQVRRHEAAAGRRVRDARPWTFPPGRGRPPGRGLRPTWRVGPVRSVGLGGGVLAPNRSFCRLSGERH
ncbi:MarR family winged helix-turn-helix transcriptional regulator [Streptomyces sp. LN325]|uniref:MarR family winged helix-turn-helix transcriptional regulator n=1 Tax=Streptomyces sp. LN325 TaxID=3112976 RepID=UPI0037102D68